MRATNGTVIASTLRAVVRTATDVRRVRRLVLALAACSLFLVPASAPGRPFAPAKVRPAVQPIEHVVIIFQENHSFDDVLGGICVQDSRCDGASTGKISTGQVIPLHAAPDIVPGVRHSIAAQTTAMHGGLMDNFDLIPGCAQKAGYACYMQYAPQQIPNLAALARTFVISDRTFESGPVPSWGSHIVLVAAEMGGFTGDNPVPGSLEPGRGWGCDSFKDAMWVPPGGGTPILVPSCIPKPDGSGPYRPSPVQWIPT
ncbi:MAG TPA: alkaline phosphatase family protein, partial [Gaiellaceae bacterium]